MSKLSDNQVSSKLLYHYTSLTGFLGIIKERKIWATNLLFLNDSLELNYAIQLLQKKLDRLKLNIGEKEKVFIKDFSDGLDNITSPFHQSFAGVYVCSFSENGNQLSQWRGYCPDGGVSIGFDFQSLPKSELIRQDFELVECLYDQNAQSAILDQFLVTLLDKFHNEENYSPKGAGIFDFLKLAPKLKHPKFEEEKEWRLVASWRSLKDTKFRVGKSKLIPYVEFYFPAVQGAESVTKAGIVCIPEVWIGPTPDPYLSSISIKNLLRSERIYSAIESNGTPKAHCLVLESDIPYRTW